MKIQELSNEEVVFIHAFMQEMMEAYEDIIENKGLLNIVKTEEGSMEIFQPLDDEHIEEIKSGKKNKLCNSIFAKLNPVVELINEVDPKLTSEVQNSLYYDTDEEI